jgi:hypothetical protein
VIAAPDPAAYDELLRRPVELPASEVTP